MKLPEKCKGREYAHDLLKPLCGEKEVVLQCKQVKVMGHGFCREVVDTLLVEGECKKLVVVDPPPHAVTYLREAAHKAHKGKRLEILARGMER